MAVVKRVALSRIVSFIMMCSLTTFGCSGGPAPPKTSAPGSVSSPDDTTVPVAGNDLINTVEDTEIILSTLLENDFDPNGDLISLFNSDSETDQGGAVINSGSNTLVYRPPTNFYGEDRFTYKISNGKHVSSAIVNISVSSVNDQPLAKDDYAETTRNTTMITADVLQNDSDIEDDELSVTAFDQNSANGATVKYNQNGSFTYTPQFNYVGEDSFSYTVSDSNGGSSISSVKIEVNQFNTAPIAIDDAYTIQVNQSISLNALRNNDFDVDGDSLSISSFDSISVDGASIVRNSYSRNTLIYTPIHNYYGTDSFSYTLSDNNGGVDVATVKMTIRRPNQSPVATNDEVTTSENTGIQLSLILLNDVDPEADLLQITNFDSITTQGGQIIQNVDNSLFYLPPLDFQGFDNFSYTISDTHNATDTASVKINVIGLADSDDFLAFLNKKSSLYSEEEETALSYYQAIDPQNRKLTLSAWYSENGFNQSIRGLDADAYAVYINNADLGFARHMVIRKDSSNNVYSCVENYSTIPEATARQNVIATVCMEYSPAASDTLDEDDKFTKFFTYGPDGSRVLGADLDGRGFKYQPGLCNTCHGGRPGRVENGVYSNKGDTNAGFIPWDLNNYKYSTTDPLLSRASQEQAFKQLNSTLLKTYPPDEERPQVELIYGWYGGATLPSSIFNGSYIPPGWLPPVAPTEAQQLYLQVIAPSCRACHIQRGNIWQSDIDFSSYDKFISYADQIDSQVYQKSSMPLALRTFELFWSSLSPKQNVLLSTFLENFNNRGVNDTTLKPGRPIANAGVSRKSPLLEVVLNGKASLFASSYSWTMVTKPENSQAILRNEISATPSFLPDVEGNYTIELFVGSNNSKSSPAQVSITAIRSLQPVSLKTDVVPILNGQCAGSVCHTSNQVVDFIGNQNLHSRLIEQINMNEPELSSLIRKPSGNHHFGGTRSGFSSKSDVNYELMMRWILEGAKNN